MDAPLLAHAPDALASLRRPTADDPLRVLISGCLAGRPCGVDATDYGMGHALGDLVALPTVRDPKVPPHESPSGSAKPSRTRLQPWPRPDRRSRRRRRTRKQPSWQKRLIALCTA